MCHLRWPSNRQDRRDRRVSVHRRHGSVRCVRTMGAIPSHKGSAMTSGSFFFFLTLALSLTLTLTPRLALPLSLPLRPLAHPLGTVLWYTYLVSLPTSTLLTGSSHLFVWRREGVALFLDLNEMRVECRMWKRSGTNGGLVQGQSTKTKPHWAGCRCCICGGKASYLQLQVPLGPLGSPWDFARALGWATESRPGLWQIDGGVWALGCRPG